MNRKIGKWIIGGLLACALAWASVSGFRAAMQFAKSEHKTMQQENRSLSYELRKAGY